MMEVGVVGVTVGERGMLVKVAVGLARRVVGRVLVTVVLVVDVEVGVHERLVDVPVLVPLGQVEPETGPHEGGGGHKQRGHGVLP